MRFISNEKKIVKRKWKSMFQTAASLGGSQGIAVSLNISIGVHLIKLTNLYMYSTH